MLWEENKACLRGETEDINSVLSERGEGTLHLKVLLAKTRAPSMHLARVDRGKSEVGPHHLQLLLLPPLGGQVVEAVAAFLHQSLRFTQPVLHGLCTHFKVFHLDL